MSEEANSPRVRLNGEAKVVQKPAEFQEAPGEEEAQEVRGSFFKGANPTPGGVAVTLSGTDPASRANALSRLQQDLGNAYVQRVIAEARGSSGQTEVFGGTPYVQRATQSLLLHRDDTDTAVGDDAVDSASPGGQLQNAGASIADEKLTLNLEPDPKVRANRFPDMAEEWNDFFQAALQGISGAQLSAKKKAALAANIADMSVLTMIRTQKAVNRAAEKMPDDKSRIDLDIAFRGHSSMWYRSFVSALQGTSSGAAKPSTAARQANDIANEAVQVGNLLTDDEWKAFVESLPKD
jgi:hypothetical protein